MQTRFVVGAALVFGAMMAIAVVSYFQNQEAYYTVDELLGSDALYANEAPPVAPGDVALAAETAPDGPRMQVRGVVDETTVERTNEGLEMQFVLEGKDARLPVVYHGMVPDTFDLAESVTVGGTVAENGTFVADELFVQCPSKYEAVPPGKDGAAEHPAGVGASGADY